MAGSPTLALSPIGSKGTILNDNDVGSETKERKRFSALIPTTINSCEEYDDYASVGFSLTDIASTTSSSLRDNKEHDDGGYKLGKPKQYPQELVHSPPSECGETYQKTKNKPDSSPPRLQRVLFQSRSSSSEGSITQPFSQQLPQQKVNSSKLKSKLQHEFLKCQSPSESMSSQHPSTAQNGDGSNISVDKNFTANVSQPCNSSSDIFGAWAQIETLQQRCIEAEERVRLERRRAEMAIFEKRCLVQEHSHQEGAAHKDNLCRENGRQRVSREFNKQVQDLNEQGSNGGQVPGSNEDDDIPSSLCETFTTEEAEHGPPAERRCDVVIPMTIHKREVLHAPQIEAVVPNIIKKKSSVPKTSPQSSLASPQNEFNDALALQSWKKRALEAEKRLAATIADDAPSLPVADAWPPNAAARSLDRGSPDLIRLKNAEIECLRSQIHRLECCIREEGEHSYLRLCNKDIMVPPLLVPPAESNGSRSAETEEFRFLRNEIRQLQHQLRINEKNNANNGATTANSTTGESTLSSLEYDNVNACNDDGEREEREIEEMQEEDTRNSSLSLWGLCCVRGSSRRGYGSVLAK